MRDVSEIHPDMTALLKARRFIQPANSPEEKRANWTRYTAAIAVPCPAHIGIEDHLVQTDARGVPVRVYRQAGSGGMRPVVVYLHGGGFMMGDLDSSDSIAWGLCDQVDAVVVSVDYRLTPEFVYPAAFDDCYGVLLWLSRNAATFGGDGARIAFVGDSAGGSLAAACCLAARDRGGPKIAGQALVYPTLGAPATLASYEENRDGPSLTTASMIYYNDVYFEGERYSGEPYAAPIKAPDLAGLPPAYIHTAQFDPIRDDGRVYAGRLIEAGVWTTYREARRMLHGFLRMREAGPDARAEFAGLCGFLKGVLAAV